MKTVHNVLHRLILAMLLAVFAYPALASPFSKVKVMTRNVYLGADIFSVVEAAQANPQLLPVAVAEAVGTVLQTNFPERAQALAAEIKLYKPHLIGLQEVSLYRTQFPGDAAISGPLQTPAETVLLDYLAILMAALEQHGLNYRVAVATDNADLEFPMITLDPATGELVVDAQGNPILTDVRLTDRDVILVRGDVDTANPFGTRFQAQLSLDLAGIPVEFTRGYNMVDATIKGETYRFVNTHLEVNGNPADPAFPFFQQVQAGQMFELLTVLDSEPSNIIMVGDFNSAPESAPTQPYAQALAAGFTDVWLKRRRPADGFTCCFDERVSDPDAMLTSRIDHIFIRLNDKTLLKAKSKVVGDSEIELTPNGLWPSDHAGVVSKLKLFNGVFW